MGYKEKFDQMYEEYVSLIDHQTSKNEFLSNEIFDFITYDGEYDEIFSRQMIDVIEALLNKQTFEFHSKSTGHYHTYLTMVNMPFLRDKLDWGTSIRGAWFDDYSDGEYEIANFKIPKTELSNFMRDLVEWSK